jgi:uncharacterized protein (DUF4415 family)
MPLKTKSGRMVQVPTPQEDMASTQAIASDPESRELDSEWFAHAQTVSAVLGAQTLKGLMALKRPRGRPKADTTKVFTAIRLDADLVDAFKSTGKGWQTRINAALRQHITAHPINK